MHVQFVILAAFNVYVACVLGETPSVAAGDNKKTYLSTAIATSVKTEAETDIP